VFLENVVHACWVAAGIIGFLEAFCRLRQVRWLRRIPDGVWDLLEVASACVALGTWAFAIDELSLFVLPVTAAVVMDLHWRPDIKQRHAWATGATLVGFVALTWWWPVHSPILKWVNCILILLAVLLTRFNLSPLTAVPFVLTVAALFVFVPHEGISFMDVVVGSVASLLFVTYCHERRRRERALRESLLDHLTRCLNRRGAYRWIQNHKDEWVTAIIVDLDEFKFVNDTYGHDVGDQLLQETARRLQECVRAEDAVIRWGGDEFLILLVSPPSSENPEKVAERIHQGLTSQPLELNPLPKPFYIRASIGIATGRLNDDLLNRADQALLRIKRFGKNAVMAWSGTSSTPSYEGEYVSFGRHLNWAVQAFQSIVRNSPVGFVLTTEDHTIIDVNPAFEKMTGYPRSELVGRKPSVLASHAVANTELYRRVRDELTKHKQWAGTFQNVRSNGDRWNAQEYIGAVELGNNTVGYCSVVIPDQASVCEASPAAAAATMKENQENHVDLYASFLSGLAHIAEMGIPGLPEHVDRVQQYVHWLGELAAAHDIVNDEDVQLIAMASVAHDIGKAFIARELLLKPSALTKAEYAYVQSHAEIGRDMLMHFIGRWVTVHNRPIERLLAFALDIAWTHHERWDGQGYPRGLAGHDIPFAGRLTAIADVLDALLSPRPYKNAWPEERVASYFREQKGRQFDPTLTDLLLQHWSHRPCPAIGNPG
jgi:diguanylate cyclase (GGDEF)-like protein/PAS domain S-box-containing protein